MITNLELKQSDIFKSLLVLNFTSGESTLKDLDLFVKKSQLIISSDKLSTKNISFIDDILEIFLEFLNFIIRFFDDEWEFLDFSILLLSKLFTILVLQFKRFG